MTFKILVFEDDPEIQLKIKQGFIENQNKFEAVFEKIALDIIEKTTGTEDFDAVIIDMSAQFADVIEIIKVIHMSEPDLPIIAITDTQDMDMKSCAFMHGATSIIEKPVDVSALCNAVKKVLSID